MENWNKDSRVLAEVVLVNFEIEIEVIKKNIKQLIFVNRLLKGTRQKNYENNLDEVSKISL